MKRLLLIWTILLPLWVAAQESYAGRDFWVTSTVNPLIEVPDSTVLYIVGDTVCAGYVENPSTSYYQTFSVTSNQVTLVKIPSSEIQYEYDSSPVQIKGIHISSTRDVYVFLQNSLVDTFLYNFTSSIPNFVNGCHTNKCPILPSSLLNSQYSINETTMYSHPRYGFPCDLLIVALEDATIVDCGSAGIRFLNKGEVAFVPRHNNIHSNCKRMALYETSHYGTWLFPIFRNRYLFVGKDYITRKSGNNSFAKNHGFDYANYYDALFNSGVTAARYYCNTFENNSNIIFSAITYEVWAYHSAFCSHYTLPHLWDVSYIWFRYSDFIQFYMPALSVRNLGYNFTFFNSGASMGIGGGAFIIGNSKPRIPNDVMVKKWVIPTTRRNVNVVNRNYDTTFAELDIYVHENGLHSTYLNDQLLPASVFDTVPFTNREYWVAQFGYYNDSIPEIIRVENPNGFSAYLDEFGYTPVGPNTDSIWLCYWHDNNSGVNFETAPVEHSNLSPYNGDTVYRCLGDTLHLDVEYNPDSLEFDWIVDGVTHYNTRTLDIPITDLHTITAQLVIHYPCPDTTTTFVRVVLPPVIPFSSDTILCAGATLSAENPDAILYSWSTGETSPAITVDSAGIYSVTVANRGCTANLDSFRVDLYEPSHVNFGGDTILCDLATLLLDATQTHPATYEWQDHSTNTTYLVIHDGEYWVVVTDHCLGASDTIAVDYLQDFEVNLGADTTLCEGDELVLTAGLPFCTYRWQDGSTEPRYVVRQPGSYSVTATNFCHSHSGDIDIVYEPCVQELWMPNAFTPNGDGLNDRFVPIFSHPDEIESFEMMVYDRLGSMVFLTKDMDAGWDGGDLPAGMYVWVIRYKSAREEMRVEKGNVMVIR